MNRSLIVLFAALLLYVNAFGQPTQELGLPQVDERVELLSVAFRLAGAEEYTQNTFPLYVESIEDHFRSHENHPLIPFIQQELFPLEIGYDAVMCMAVSISNPPQLQPLIPFTDNIPEARWNPEVSKRFLTLLRDFYTTTEAKQFFAENQSMYAAMETQFQRIYEQIDLPWYEAFFGVPPKDQYQILLGLGNGLANYSTKTNQDDSETIYAILGAWNVGKEGYPEYKTKDFMPMLVHELNHPYANSLILDHEQGLQQAGTLLFAQVEDQMRPQAYENWVVMLQEGLVRACVIQYMQDHDFPIKQIRTEIDRQHERGFFWTQELVELLHDYEHNRNAYPTLSDYMPQVVAFFNHQSSHLTSK